MANRRPVYREQQTRAAAPHTPAHIQKISRAAKTGQVKSPPRQAIQSPKVPHQK